MIRVLTKSGKTATAHISVNIWIPLRTARSDGGFDETRTHDACRRSLTAGVYHTATCYLLYCTAAPRALTRLSLSRAVHVVQTNM